MKQFTVSLKLALQFNPFGRNVCNRFVRVGEFLLTHYSLRVKHCSVTSLTISRHVNVLH